MEYSISKIIKRNVLFWGKSAEFVFALMAVFSIVYGLIFYSNDEASAGYSIIFYTIVFGLAGSMIVMMSYGMAYIPIIISFGAGRKEAIAGLQISAWIFIMQMEALLWVSGFVCKIPMKDISKYAIAGLVLMIIGISIGQLFSVICIRFERKKIFRILIIIIMIFIVSVTNILFLSQNEDMKEFLPIFLYVVYFMTALCYVASTIFSCRFMMTYEVR